MSFSGCTVGAIDTFFSAMSLRMLPILFYLVYINEKIWGNIHLINTIFRQHYILMGCLNYLKWIINGEIIIYNARVASLYLENLLPKRFRISASSEVYNQQCKSMKTLR